MRLSRLFGRGDEETPEEGVGNVVIRVEVGGKTYVQRYADLEMAQIRFPQYLADLQALHGARAGEESES